MKVVTLTSKTVAPEVANLLNSDLLRVTYGFYPDGELKLRYMGNMRKDIEGEDVLIVQSTFPNPHYMFDALASLPRFLKKHGANYVIAVATYLAYLRQSEEHASKDEVPLAPEKILQFNKKNSSSNLYLDELYVVTPHSTDVLGQCEPFKGIIDDNESLAMAVGKELKRLDAKDVAVIAPDDNAIPKARNIAKLLGLPHGNFDKTRLSGTEVEIIGSQNIPKAEDYIIVDDMISTGSTDVLTADYLKKGYGGKRFIAVCSHPLMTIGAVERLKDAGFSKIIGTDSIENKFGDVRLAPLIVSKIGK